MRAVILQIILGLMFSAVASAAIYQWTDERGVIHFTDDPGAVPKRYEKRTKVIPTSDAERVQAAPAEAAPEKQATEGPRVTLYGGHGEMWWKSRYGALHTELKELQGELPARQAELEQLKRTYFLFAYTRNRIAYQNKETQVRQIEERIATLNGELSALDAEAARAGVPFEWRQ
jgi:hypothetical protein